MTTRACNSLSPWADSTCSATSVKNPSLLVREASRQQESGLFGSAWCIWMHLWQKKKTCWIQNLFQPMTSFKIKVFSIFICRWILQPVFTTPHHMHHLVAAGCHFLLLRRAWVQSFLGLTVAKWYRHCCQYGTCSPQPWHWWLASWARAIGFVTSRFGTAVGRWLFWLQI